MLPLKFSMDHIDPMPLRVRRPRVKTPADLLFEQMMGDLILKRVEVAKSCFNEQKISPEWQEAYRQQSIYQQELDRRMQVEDKSLNSFNTPKEWLNPESFQRDAVEKRREAEYEQAKRRAAEYEQAKMERHAQAYGGSINRDPTPLNQIGAWSSMLIYPDGRHIGVAPKRIGLYIASPTRSDYIRYWDGSQWSGAWKAGEPERFIEMKKHRRFAVQPGQTDGKTMYWRAIV